MLEIDNVKKNLQKNYSFNSKYLEQLRDSINKIEPNLIIKDALNFANKKLSENSKKKLETLDQAKKSAINDFLFEINNSDKNYEQINLLSKQKIEDFKNSANLIVERTQKEAKEYIFKLDLINKENQMLEKKYIDLKNQFEDFEIKQKSYISQIEQMEKSSKLLTLNRPIFNEFLKQFKSHEPKKIIEDLEKQKNGFILLDNEYNSTINKIIFSKKIFDLKVEREEKKISELNTKIHDLEDENALVLGNIQSDIEELKREINNLQGLKEENDKYRKMLYQLYNRLIGAFSLDKDVNFKTKSLSLKKADYKPNLLDENEIFKYIKLMISSMNRSTSDQLLRETIAYCNMITRVYLKNKINLKYEPYSTFKELKDIMDKNEDTIEKLGINVKEYEKKLKKIAMENKKLNKIINFFYKEKNRNIEMKQGTLNMRYRKQSTNEKSSREFSTSKKRNGSINSRFRVESAKYVAKNNIFKRKKMQEEMLQSNKSAINKMKKSNSSLNIYEDNIDFKYLRNPLYQSIQSMKCNKVQNKNESKIIDIKKENNQENEKENKYKGINEQNIVTYFNEFKQLVEHTNRLFLYQAKMSPKYYLEKNRNLSQNKTKFHYIYKLPKMKKKVFNQSTGNLLQNFVKDKIMSKINGIINNLRFKDDNKKIEKEAPIN